MVCSKARIRMRKEEDVKFGSEVGMCVRVLWMAMDCYVGRERQDTEERVRGGRQAAVASEQLRSA